MGLIYKKLRFTAQKSSKIFNVLMDTGASESFINKKEAKAIGKIVKMATKKRYELGKGFFDADEVIFTDVDINGYSLHWTFVVVPGLSDQAIIGADFFQRWKIKLAPETERIILDPKALRLKLV